MSQSDAELLLSVQLDQAGIPYEREYQFHPTRKWRADFEVYPRLEWMTNRLAVGTLTSLSAPILVEIDGGAFIAGRHSRGTGVEKDAEKQSAAAILGYRVIRATPRQVENGLALQWIQEALGLKERAA